MSTRAFAPSSQDKATGNGPEPLDGSRIAVFDLDRTLLPGSSLALLGSALARHGPIGKAELARQLRTAASFGRHGERSGQAARLLGGFLAAVTGRDATPLRDVAASVGGDLAAAAYPAARWLLDRHLAAGDFCVIARCSRQIRPATS